MVPPPPSVLCPTPRAEPPEPRVVRTLSAMSVVYLKAKNRKSGQMEQVGFDGSEVLVGKLKELVRLLFCLVFSPP